MSQVPADEGLGTRGASTSGVHGLKDPRTEGWLDEEDASYMGVLMQVQNQLPLQPYPSNLGP